MPDRISARRAFENLAVVVGSVLFGLFLLAVSLLLSIGVNDWGDAPGMGF
jgi:hypothetical protein